MRHQHTPASLMYDHGSLVLRCDYNPDLVGQIKSLPYTERKWDPGRTAWVVAPKHGQYISTLVAQYLGELVMAPQGNSKAQSETRVLEVRYIGMTKDRGDGSRSAFGYSDREWAVIFPEDILQAYFLVDDQKPNEAPTLYGVLGVSRKATHDEIKTAFRRLAKQWHPDHCRDSDAQEQFIKIKNAYDILTTSREKYNAGLALQATINQYDAGFSQKFTPDGYRSPLRCGYILAEGVDQVGRFVVSKIIDWQDVTNPRGQTLVVSWPYGAKAPTEQWV